MKPSKNCSFHYLYKITCEVTGKFYYGIHSTNNLNDGYLGSGKLVKLSVKKHGTKTHTKSIICMHPTRESAALHEAQIVTAELLQDPLCMNLQTGGESNIEFSQKTLVKLKKSPEQKLAISKRRKGRATLVTQEQRSAHSLKISGEGNGMFGADRPESWRKTMSHLQKQRIASGVHHFCNQPSQVKGRKWYHNPLTRECRMLTACPDGWKPGRK